MDPSVGVFLWIAAILLMGGAVVGLILTLLLGKPITEVDRLRARPEAAAVAVTEIPAEPVAEEDLSVRRRAYRTGLYVFLGLAVLTVIEFLVAAQPGGGTALLFVLILAKAGLIVQYYMHADRLWSEAGGH